MSYIKILFTGFIVITLLSCQNNSEENPRQKASSPKEKSFISKVEYGMPVYEFRELLKEVSPDCYARLEYEQNCVFRFKNIQSLQNIEWSLYAVPWNNGNLQRFILFNEFSHSEAERIYTVLKDHLTGILDTPDSNTQDGQQREVKWNSDKRMVKITLQSNTNNKYSIMVYYMFKYSYSPQ